MGLAYLVASGNALAIFDYFTSSVTVFGSLTWISILASHVGFMRGMKAQGLSRDTLPYKAVCRFHIGVEGSADASAIPAILDLLCPILHLRPYLLQGIRFIHAIRVQDFHHTLHRYSSLRVRLSRIQMYVPSSNFSTVQALTTSDPKDQGSQDARNGSFYWLSRVRRFGR